MKRTFASNVLGSGVLAGLLVLGAFWAGSPLAANATFQPESEQNTGGTARLYRVAIPTQGKLGDLLRKNAQISSGFEVIERKTLPAHLARATDFGNKADWDAVGADILIIAEEGGAQIKIRMYDVAKGDKPILSKGYPAGDPLSASNKFMNEVINFYTKEPGVFGSRVAFVRTRRNPNTSKNVQTVQMNGEAPAGVTSNRSLNVLPSIGPGGQVLFTSYAKRNPDLWVSSGGAPKRISKWPGVNLGGVMSPDGGSIVLALSKDGNAELYKIGLDGSVQTRLTNHPGIDGSPSSGPAGQIAFMSDRAGGPQIYTMGGGGGGANRVTKQGKYNQAPDWNHGKGRSQWIIFSGRDSSNRFAIFKVDIKSGKQVPLSTAPGRNLDPSWSPDGRMFAYDKGGGIYIANEDGDNNVQIAQGGSTPDWGPGPSE